MSVLEKAGQGGRPESRLMDSLAEYKITRTNNFGRGRSQSPANPVAIKEAHFTHVTRFSTLRRTIGRAALDLLGPSD